MFHPDMAMPGDGPEQVGILNNTLHCIVLKIGLTLFLESVNLAAIMCLRIHRFSC